MSQATPESSPLDTIFNLDLFLNDKKDFKVRITGNERKVQVTLR